MSLAKGSSKIVGSLTIVACASAGVTKSSVWSVPRCFATAAAYGDLVVSRLAKADRKGPHRPRARLLHHRDHRR